MENPANIVLRPYQETAISSGVNWVKYMSGKNGIIWAATAAGKSILIARIAEAFPDKRVLILAHRKELLEQNVAKFAADTDVSIFSAGLGKKDLTGRVVMAGIQSIANMSADLLPNFDLILIDECHRLSNNAEDDSQYWNIINKVGSPQVLGFTATPYRLSGGFLSWGEIIYEIKYPELLDLKFVTPLSNKATATPDLSKVKVKLGEYVESQLEEIMLDPALLQAAIESLLVYSNDRNSVLIFAISKKHCELLCEAMKESGIAGGVGFITGDTTDSERARLLEMFKAGELRYLINCMVLIEGFDAPCIDMIMCLRPTMSKTLWEQMLGRGVRLFSGKDNCLVVDMAGNLVKHGSLAAPYVAPKMGEPPKGDAGRVCPECEEFNEGTNITECESCGYEFPPPEGRTHSHNYEPDIDSPTIYRAIQRYEVESVSYRKHVKTANGNISLRVDYVCHGAPYGSFSEWISFMHETETTAQWMQNKAWKFFKDRGIGLPDEIQKLSMDTLLALAEQLRQPVAVLVDTSQKFPTIKEYIWSEADETEDRESNSSRCSELVQEVYDLDEVPF